MNLHLVLTHHWFDMVEEGKKTIEYRRISPHWKRMIWDRREQLKTVSFSRAYTPQKITKRISNIDIGTCPIPGWDGQYYRIHLAEGLA